MSLQYAGELIAAFIGQAGGTVKGPISTGSVPKGLEPSLRSPASRAPFRRFSVVLLHGLEQLHREPGFSGNRRTA